MIFGPVHYGFQGIYNWQGELSATPDGTNWFPDKYLPAIKTASDAYGKPLVDVYDFHWYSEATDGSDANHEPDRLDSDRRPGTGHCAEPTQLVGSDLHREFVDQNHVLESTPHQASRLDCRPRSTPNFRAQRSPLPSMKMAATTTSPERSPRRTISASSAVRECSRRLVATGQLPIHTGGISRLPWLRWSDGQLWRHLAAGHLKQGAERDRLRQFGQHHAWPLVFVAINRSTSAQVTAINGPALSGTAPLYQMTAASAQTQVTAGSPRPTNLRRTCQPLARR